LKKSILKYKILTFLCLWIVCFSVSAKNKKNNQTIQSDTTQVVASSADSTTVEQSPKKKSKIDAPVSYTAKDSIVLYKSGKAYMYGESKVNYDKIELEAEFIQLNADSSIVDACGKEDENGELIGTPVFKDNGEEYQSKTLSYNFDTKKGFIRQVSLQQGEGYILGNETKKIDEDIMCMKDGRYTTCDKHDHPHFYLHLTKAKVKQKKWVVSGPAYMVLLDIPLPLALPFGYFPFTKSYSSGLIIPSFGDELMRGFYLRNLGYYFAINDYFDLTLLGDIYTKGTWAVTLSSRYIKRYKFSGNLNISYRNDIYGEKGLPDYQVNRNFAVNWTHTQNPKSSPNSTFSASVNFSTSGYDRSDVNNYYNPALLSQNTKSSSINYTYNFPETPFSIAASLLLTQRTADSTISATLPDFTVTMNRIYPFKRKNKVGKEKWYEKIYLSGSVVVNNSIETKEDKILKSNILTDWKNGMNLRIPIGASFTLFKYINITPTINYQGRLYFQQVNQSWDYTTDQLHRDTIAKVGYVQDFSVAMSMSTKLYGFYTPIRKIFGDKIGKIRHVITPSVSISYKPDFGTPFWGYYKSYERKDKNGNVHNIDYSPYANGQYGVPSKGMMGVVNFSLNNNLEMKWKMKNDTTDEVIYKTISLIDGFSINGNYNIAADSLRWSNINMNLRLKITKGFTLNVNGIFDMYKYGINEFDNPVHINKLRWSYGEAPRLTNVSTSFSYSFSNNTFKKKNKDDGKSAQEENIKGLTEANTDTEMSLVNKKAQKQSEQKSEQDDDGYQKINIPWTLSFDYSLRYGNTNEFNRERMEYNRELTHNLGVRGTISLTSKWNFSMGLSWDISNNKITYSTIGVTRNLHCWSMSANIVPFGIYKSYNFVINVNASMLSDLKYEQNSDHGYQTNWY
jgi:lipopolysaccharide assembly outer membrane protein LptD (OstA)